MASLAGAWAAVLLRTGAATTEGLLAAVAAFLPTEPTRDQLTASLRAFAERGCVEQIERGGPHWRLTPAFVQSMAWRPVAPPPGSVRAANDG